MIIDITGIELIPGNLGRDCAGNGEHIDQEGKLLECCCDECDYMKCCFEFYIEDRCRSCNDSECPRISKRNNSQEFMEEQIMTDYQKAFYELYESVTKVLEDLHRSQVKSFRISKGWAENEVKQDNETEQTAP